MIYSNFNTAFWKKKLKLTCPVQQCIQMTLANDCFFTANLPKQASAIPMKTRPVDCTRFLQVGIVSPK